jgi:hypothetical protein
MNATGVRVLIGPSKRSAVRPQINRPGIPTAFMTRRMVREVDDETLMMSLPKMLIYTVCQDPIEGHHAFEIELT